MASLNSRGAKFSISSRTKLLEILSLEKVSDYYTLIAQAAEDFEKGNEKYEKTKVVKTPQKIKEHIENEVLSDKSLGSVICYIFFSQKDAKIILEKIINLFHIISVKEKRSHREKLNELINRNIQEKAKKVENPEIFPPNLDISIDYNWKINSNSKYQEIKDKKEIASDLYIKSSSNESPINEESEKSKEAGSNQPTENIKKPTKRSFRWLYILISIFGFLLVLFLVLRELGNKLISPVENLLTENVQGMFDPDPSGHGQGFLSISRVEQNIANEYDYGKVPNLKDGEKFEFIAFIDFHNMGILDIKNAKGKINYSYNPQRNELTLTGELFGDNVASIYDTSVLTEYLPNYEIHFVKGKIENTHYSTDAHYCAGYQYDIPIGEEVLEEGVSLGVLDTYQEGWCDQGYIYAQFEVIKKD